MLYFIHALTRIHTLPNASLIYTVQAHTTDAIRKMMEDFS